MSQNTVGARVCTGFIVRVHGKLQVVQAAGLVGAACFALQLLGLAGPALWRLKQEQSKQGPAREV